MACVELEKCQIISIKIMLGDISWTGKKVWWCPL